MIFETHHLTLFFAAALLLAVMPGPGIFYVLARSLAGGTREGIHSSLGTFVGGLFHVFAAAHGLVFLQFAVLGCFSATLNTAADLAVVIMAAPRERKLKNGVRFRRRQRTTSGLGRIGLGAYLAFADSK